MNDGDVAVLAGVDKGIYARRVFHERDSLLLLPYCKETTVLTVRTKDVRILNRVVCVRSSV